MEGSPPTVCPVPNSSKSCPSNIHAGGLSPSPADCSLPIRCLWLPDLWSWRGAGCLDVLPLQRHPCCPCPGLHHPLCADFLSHPALLWPVSAGRRKVAGGGRRGSMENPPAMGLCPQGCLGGSLAPLHWGDSGGGRGSGAEEAPASDHQLVPPDTPPGSLHP